MRGEVLDRSFVLLWRIGGFWQLFLQDPFDCDTMAHRAPAELTSGAAGAREIHPDHRNFCFGFAVSLASSHNTTFVSFPPSNLLPLLIAGPVRNIQKEQPTAPSHCITPEYLGSKSEPQYLRPAHPAPANPFLYAPWRTSAHLSENCICVPEPRSNRAPAKNLCELYRTLARFRSSLYHITYIYIFR